MRSLVQRNIHQMFYSSPLNIHSAKLFALLMEANHSEYRTLFNLFVLHPQGGVICLGSTAFAGWMDPWRHEPTELLMDPPAHSLDVSLIAPMTLSPLCLLSPLPKTILLLWDASHCHVHLPSVSKVHFIRAFSPLSLVSSSFCAQLFTFLWVEFSCLLTTTLL